MLPIYSQFPIPTYPVILFNLKLPWKNPTMDLRTLKHCVDQVTCGKFSQLSWLNFPWMVALWNCMDTLRRVIMWIHYLIISSILAGMRAKEHAPASSVWRLGWLPRLPAAATSPPASCLRRRRSCPSEARRAARMAVVGPSRFFPLCFCPLLSFSIRSPPFFLLWWLLVHAWSW